MIQLNIFNDIWNGIASIGGFFGGSASNAAESVSQFFNSIKSAVSDVFDMFNIFIDFIPSPFKEILAGSVLILTVVIIWRIIKG